MRHPLQLRHLLHRRGRRDVVPRSLRRPVRRHGRVSQSFATLSSRRLRLRRSGARLLMVGWPVGGNRLMWVIYPCSKVLTAMIQFFMHEAVLDQVA